MRGTRLPGCLFFPEINIIILVYYLCFIARSQCSIKKKLNKRKKSKSSWFTQNLTRSTEIIEITSQFRYS